jgi:hydrogenase expression/formation protein HypD
LKYLDEYRDAALAEKLVAAIRREAKRPWTLMEVCGGQTHSIVRFGVDTLLPSSIELVHGPGCPVCVTPLELVDRAQAIARTSGVVFCSFGDMLRVPGSNGDLARAKAEGADVRVVYSPLDALALARANPEREIVFFAVGFETTAPANALAVKLARERGVENFSVLVSHVLVPPAVRSIFAAPDNRVEALLGPGHVCTVMGTSAYELLASEIRVPIVITGFEPIDLLEGVLRAVRQLERGDCRVEVQYARAVTRAGSAASIAVVDEVFEVCARTWRGIGVIPNSGYRLRDAYAAHDAERRFDVSHLQTRESSSCISGQILRGVRKPTECREFGARCTPERPLGATMVSSEGACAAYFNYGRERRAARTLELVS